MLPQRKLPLVKSSASSRIKCVGKTDSFKDKTAVSTKQVVLGYKFVNKKSKETQNVK